ncbi:hypothetical protein [Paracoccus onubensis]|uniref:Uncharacterized protein n=1 Tax=Paracoccus onubensis TaxID=1675788 RepID=A0A418T4W5_9RHOB|nr:hypothetical protein [Paracoccus onubensis]RJE88239.1 hypothetical protein D3P04_04885 [Paracoccus onubensis]
MANDQTIANAVGNAQGLMHVAEGREPSELEFRAELTAEEELLHFYFNDEILEVAEEYQSLIAERAEDQANIDNYNAGQQKIFEEARQFGADREYQPIPLAPRLLADYEEKLAGCEERVAQIIAQVRSQFHDRALNLTERREDIVDYVATISKHEERQDRYDAAETDEERQENWVGFDPDTQRTYYDFRELDRIHAEYELLKNGISINPTRIDWAGLVWFGVSLIVVEIVTAGLINVAVGAVGVGTRWVVSAAGKAGRIATAADRIRRRYNALSDRAKDFLERAYLRSRNREVPDYPNTGPQAVGSTGRRSSVPCLARACKP